MLPPRTILLSCRPELTDTLLHEVRHTMVTTTGASVSGPGLIEVKLPPDAEMPECIFERQRLPDPAFLPASLLKPIADETIQSIFGTIVSEHPLWSVQFITQERDEDDAGEHLRRLDGIWNTSQRQARKVASDIEKRFRPLHRLKPGGILLKLLLTKDGLWHSRQTLHESMKKRDIDQRMKWDPLAPSRSFLKMEEALEEMECQPVPGEHVIDLGAAPGGWTYSFVKRGCHVISVDHGPMKLPPPQPGWGEAQHVRENGITYRPPPDWPTVDWLVADMLIAPGVAMGLIRRWLESGQAKRIVCNIKLPQEEPYASIMPLLDLMKNQSTYRYRIKQLYHDRREITVMGWRDHHWSSATEA